jgi:hypothetical protein
LDEAAHTAKLLTITETSSNYKKMCEFYLLKDVEKQLHTKKKLESEKATGTQFTGFAGTKLQILT